MCTQAGCSQCGVKLETTHVEEWPLILLEDVAAKGDAVHTMLGKMQAPHLLRKGLRCEGCNVWKDVTERTAVRQLARLLCFGMSRNGAVQEGRMRADPYEMVCPDEFISAGDDKYELVALVQHIAMEQHGADGGHYITWVRKQGCWEECDDAIVRQKTQLPDDIWNTVVVATYEARSSPAEPGKHVSAEPLSTVSSKQSIAVQEQAEAAEDEACAGHGVAGLLPEDNDGQMEAEDAMQKLLERYRAGEDCMSLLRGLPHIASEVEAISLGSITRQLPQVVQEYMQSHVTATEAVELSQPLWRTTFFPVYVLLEAWSRTTGIPAVFYVDSFHTLLASLLHKDVCYNVAGFPCRSRYWAVGTAAPGSGKSPSLEPLKEALLEVLREQAEMAPGVAVDNFHVQQLGTHAAAVDKLLDTRGYQFFGASEGGPILCPTWPASSTWNQSTHVNWQRYLDAATGLVGRKTVGRDCWDNEV